jgi:hypothetical protein
MAGSCERSTSGGLCGENSCAWAWPTLMDETAKRGASRAPRRIRYQADLVFPGPERSRRESSSDFE